MLSVRHCALGLVLRCYSARLRVRVRMLLLLLLILLQLLLTLLQLLLVVRGPQRLRKQRRLHLLFAYIPVRGRRAIMIPPSITILYATLRRRHTAVGISDGSRRPVA